MLGPGLCLLSSAQHYSASSGVGEYFWIWWQCSAPSDSCNEPRGPSNPFSEPHSHPSTSKKNQFAEVKAIQLSITSNSGHATGRRTERHWKASGSAPRSCLLAPLPSWWDGKENFKKPKPTNQTNKQKKTNKKWSRIFKHIAHSLSSVFRAVSSFHLALARLCFMQSFGTATLCKVLNCNAQRHSLVSVGFTGYISDTAVIAWLCSLWNSIASSEAQVIFSMY